MADSEFQNVVEITFDIKAAKVALAQLKKEFKSFSKDVESKNIGESIFIGKANALKEKLKLYQEHYKEYLQAPSISSGLIALENKLDSVLSVFGDKVTKKLTSKTKVALSSLLADINVIVSEINKRLNTLTAGGEAAPIPGTVSKSRTKALTKKDLKLSEGTFLEEQKGTISIPKTVSDIYQQGLPFGEAKEWMLAHNTFRKIIEAESKAKGHQISETEAAKLIARLQEDANFVAQWAKEIGVAKATAMKWHKKLQAGALAKDARGIAPPPGGGGGTLIPGGGGRDFDRIIDAVTGFYAATTKSMNRMGKTYELAFKKGDTVVSRLHEIGAAVQHALDAVRLTVEGVRNLLEMVDNKSKKLAAVARAGGTGGVGGAAIPGLPKDLAIAPDMPGFFRKGREVRTAATFFGPVEPFDAAKVSKEAAAKTANLDERIARITEELAAEKATLTKEVKDSRGRVIAGTQQEVDIARKNIPILENALQEAKELQNLRKGSFTLDKESIEKQARLLALEEKIYKSELEIARSKEVTRANAAAEARMSQAVKSIQQGGWSYVKLKGETSLSKGQWAQVLKETGEGKSTITLLEETGKKATQTGKAIGSISEKLKEAGGGNAWRGIPKSLNEWGRSLASLVIWQARWYAMKPVSMGLIEVPSQAVRTMIDYAKSIDQARAEMLRWYATSGSVSAEEKLGVENVIKRVRQELLLLPVSFDEASKSVQTFIAAGLDIGTVEKLVSPILQLKTSFKEINFEQFSVAIVGMFNTFKQQGQDASKMITDIMNQLLKAQAVSILRPEQFPRIIQHLGAVAKIAGLATEQMLALAVVVGDTGTAAGGASRYLANMMLRFARPQNVKIMTDAMKDLGWSVDEIAKLDTRKGLEGNLDIIMKLFNQLQKGAETNRGQSMKYIGLIERMFGIQAIKAATPVIAEYSKKYKELTKGIKESTQGQGGLGAAAAIMAAPIGAQWDILKNTVTEVLSAIGAGEGTIKSFLNTLMDIARGALVALNPALTEGVIQLKNLGTAGQETYVVVKGLSNVFGLLGEMLKPLGTLLTATAGGIDMVGFAIITLVNALIAKGFIKMIGSFKGLFSAMTSPTRAASAADLAKTLPELASTTGAAVAGTTGAAGLVATEAAATGTAAAFAHLAKFANLYVLAGAAVLTLGSAIYEEHKNWNKQLKEAGEGLDENGKKWSTYTTERLKEALDRAEFAKLELESVGGTTALVEERIKGIRAILKDRLAGKPREQTQEEKDKEKKDRDLNKYHKNAVQEHYREELNATIAAKRSLLDIWKSYYAALNHYEDSYYQQGWISLDTWLQGKESRLREEYNKELSVLKASQKVELELLQKDIKNKQDLVDKKSPNDVESDQQHQDEKAAIARAGSAQMLALQRKQQDDRFKLEQKFNNDIYDAYVKHWEEKLKITQEYASLQAETMKLNLDEVYNKEIWKIQETQKWYDWFYSNREISASKYYSALFNLSQRQLEIEKYNIEKSREIWDTQETGTRLRAEEAERKQAGAEERASIVSGQGFISDLYKQWNQKRLNNQQDAFNKENKAWRDFLTSNADTIRKALEDINFIYETMGPGVAMAKVFADLERSLGTTAERMKADIEAIAGQLQGTVSSMFEEMMTKGFKGVNWKGLLQSLWSGIAKIISDSLTKDIFSAIYGGLGKEGKPSALLQKMGMKKEDISMLMGASKEEVTAANTLAVQQLTFAIEKLAFQLGGTSPFANTTGIAESQYDIGLLGSTAEKSSQQLDGMNQNVQKTSNCLTDFFNRLASGVKSLFSGNFGGFGSFFSGAGAGVETSADLGMGFFGYHKGGVIENMKFHSGGLLKPNERMIIAKTGERILTEDQNKIFTGMAHKRSGPTIVNHYHIQAMDAQSFSAYLKTNRKTVANAMTMATRSDNHPIRRIN